VVCKGIKTVTFNNTIEDIKKRTGLKEPFIRKCIINLDSTFKPYLSRGSNNSFLFDENSMFLWDKIGQLKNQGLSIDKIKEQLDIILSSKSTNESTKTYSTIQNNEHSEQLLKEVKAMYKELLLSKDETIKAKDMIIDSLNHKMLLLTAGKEPDIMLKEQRQKDIDIALLKKDLSNIENKFNDRDYELSSYKKQVEKLQLQEQEKLKEQENIKAKQKSLIQELESLEGRFFVSKRKKEILKELQSINNI
jgi:DNA-binding transcriptional MerR regulator